MGADLLPLRRRPKPPFRETGKQCMLSLSLLLLLGTSSQGYARFARSETHRVLGAIEASLGIEPVPVVPPGSSTGGPGAVQPTTTHLTDVNSLQAESAAPNVLTDTQPQFGATVDSAFNSATSSDSSLASSSAAGAAAAPTFTPKVLLWPGTRRPGWQLRYHGGDILNGTINLYLIFYGNWTAFQGQDMAVIINFINSISDNSADTLGPSVHKWWNLVLQYTDGAGQSVASKVTVGKSIMMSQNYKQALNDGSAGTNDDIFGLISASIEAGSLPYDPQGVYAVLTSADVTVGPQGQGFCAWYCAWHGYKQYQGKGIPYFFVGDPSRQCSTCGSNLATVNGFPGAESMITSFAHELAESASNPNTPQYKGYWSRDLTGKGFEAADLCNRVYRDDANNLLYGNWGGTYLFNMFGIKGYKYLVQGLPSLATQKCTLQGAPPVVVK